MPKLVRPLERGSALPPLRRRRARRFYNFYPRRLLSSLFFFFSRLLNFLYLRDALATRSRPFFRSLLSPARVYRTR